MFFLFYFIYSVSFLFLIHPIVYFSFPSLFYIPCKSLPVMPRPFVSSLFMHFHAFKSHILSISLFIQKHRNPKIFSILSSSSFSPSSIYPPAVFVLSPLSVSAKISPSPSSQPPCQRSFSSFLFMPVFLNPLNSHSSPSLCSFFSPPLSVHPLFSCLEFSHSSTLPHTPVYAFSLKSPTYRIPFFRFLLTPAIKKALTRFFTQLRFSLLPAPPDLSRDPQYVPNPPPYPYTPSRNADRIPP